MIDLWNSFLLLEIFKNPSDFAFKFLDSDNDFGRMINSYPALFFLRFRGPIYSFKWAWQIEKLEGFTYVEVMSILNGFVKNTSLLVSLWNHEGINQRPFNGAQRPFNLLLLLLLLLK